MQQQTVDIELLSPAFLGDADQKAAWRTPPLKAQLRRWWRVAMAARGTTLGELRRIEGQLFGDATSEPACKSRIRLRLKNWTQQGYSDEWLRQADGKRLKMADGLNAVGYLAFGRARTKDANDSAIPAHKQARLHLAWRADAEAANAVPETLGLLHRLASIGGRASNGWGSCHVAGAPDIDLKDYAREWTDALQQPWVHAVGRDENGLLLWQTATGYASWEGVMRDLADIRKTLCKESGPLRPLLSWPVTQRKHAGMDAGDRIPNTLRLRVVRVGPDDLRGQIVHLPCRPADDIWSKKLTAADREAYAGLWQQAHNLLDARDNLERVQQ